MDDIRESFSNLKKGFKQRLRGRKHEPDGTGVDPTEKSVDSSGSLLRPESRIATSGDDGEGRGTGTDGRQVRSRDRSPQPGPVSAGGRVEVGADSGRGREVEQVYPSPSTPSIPPSGEPDSA